MIQKNIGKLVLIVSFLFYSILGSLYIKVAPPKGDELHYLLTSISLIKDHDIDLKNDYENKDYGEFYEGEIDKHTVVGRDGGEYLYHGLGLFQFLLTPFYAIGERLGVIIFLSFISSLLIYQIYNLSLNISKSKLSSLLITIFAGLSLPLSQYSILAFVEITAALVIITLMGQLVKKDYNLWYIAFLIATLPWLHLRFLPMVALLLIYLIFMTRSKKLIIPILSIVLYLLFTYFLFGTFDPTKTTREAIFPINPNGNILINSINILIDRSYGLFVYSPIYILIIPGFFFWYKRNKSEVLIISLISLSYLIPVLFYYDWNGGYSPPGRYLTPIIPILIPGIAMFLSRFSKRISITIASLLGTTGILTFVVNIFSKPNHGFMFMDGGTTLPLNFMPAYYPLKEINIRHAIILGLLAILIWILLKPVKTVEKIIKHTLVALSGLIISLIILEGLLRVFYPATTLKFYDNDIFGSALSPSQAGWFVTESKEYKSWIEVNSEGWPDIEHKIEKNKDTFRILILGDSFVENFQVPLEKRFFRQLQEKLGSQIEIVAMGRGNTGTAQQLLILKNYGLKYKPDLVVHMFLTANDIKNNSPILQNDPYLPYFEVDVEGNLVELSHAKRRVSKIKEFFKDFRLIKIILALRQKSREVEALKKVDYPTDYHVYDSSYDENYEKAWVVTKQLILETKEETEKSGAKYMLVTLANNEQVNNPVKERLFETYPQMKNAQLDFKKPDQVLMAFCRQEKIVCSHMLSHFENYISKNPNESTHFFFDGHWNETGTNLATEFLLQILSR